MPLVADPGDSGQGADALTGRHADALAAVRQHPELLERIPAIIYISDLGAAGVWHYVSPQIETVLGFTPEEWCADPRLWGERLHPDDREVAFSPEEHPPYTGEGHMSEYRMIHRDGRVVWVRDDALLLEAPDGTLRWHGVITDVTEQKRQQAELERRAAQQAAVARLGEHALEGASTSELMNEGVAAAAEILEVEVAAVAEIIPGEDALVLRAGVGWPDPAVGSIRFTGGSGSHPGHTILTGGAVMVADWEQEHRFAQSATMQQMGLRSGLAVPIEGTRGPYGALAVYAVARRSYRTGDVDFLQSLANVLADALDRQAIEDDIRHRALHDPLTGLPNRSLFLDRLEHALARLRRRRSLAAIIFLDFDHFKLVNDSLGHHVGDELLAAAAPRLKQAIRVSDTVARFGGDEFGILLEDINGERDAIETAERIAAMFARPFVLAGSEHFVSASIGIALAEGGEVASELIRDADAAMYRAKERGRARYELFDDVMRGRAIARLRVENDLRRALERGELELAYQPIVSLRDRSVIGVEALLRWQHPERGQIPPSEFIPIAEENGLIEPIGRWVLERACRQTARWHRAHPDSAPIGVSVNLSAVQVAKRDLPALVGSVLRATGLEPSCLSLEITETVMLREADALSGVLHALKDTGVRLVLDDFGTGYSSLGYLTRLPLDAFKVDRSFVDGLGTESRDSAITEAIIAMARALSLDVIAEGVEMRLQMDELIRLGCPAAQGYYFSRPVPPGALSSILRDGLASASDR